MGWGGTGRLGEGKMYCPVKVGKGEGGWRKVGGPLWKNQPA